MGNCIYCGVKLTPQKGKIRPYSKVCFDPKCITQAQRNAQKKKMKGKRKVASEWDEWARAIWKAYPCATSDGVRRCEESNVKIGNKNFFNPKVNGKNISHILSGGQYKLIYKHPWNINLLSWQCHAQWEGSSVGHKTRQNMKIYESNMMRIEMLKKIYIGYDYEKCEIYNTLMTKGIYIPVDLDYYGKL